MKVQVCSYCEADTSDACDVCGLPVCQEHGVVVGNPAKVSFAGGVSILCFGCREELETEDS